MSIYDRTNSKWTALLRIENRDILLLFDFGLAYCVSMYLFFSGKSNMIKDGIIDADGGFRDFYDEPSEGLDFTIDYDVSAITFVYFLLFGCLRVSEIIQFAVLKSEFLTKFNTKNSFFSILNRHTSSSCPYPFIFWVGATHHFLPLSSIHRHGIIHSFLLHIISYITHPSFFWPFSSSPSIHIYTHHSFSHIFIHYFYTLAGLLFSSDVATADLTKGRFFELQPYIKYKEFCMKMAYKTFEDLENSFEKEVIKEEAARPDQGHAVTECAFRYGLRQNESPREPCRSEQREA